MATRALLLALLIWLLPHAPRAEMSEAEVERLQQRVLELEDRLLHLEQSGQRAAPVDAADESWVTLSGSSTLAYFSGRNDSLFEEDRSQVWDTRFFIDAELARGATFGDRALFDHASFAFEWNLSRLGYLANDIGDAYLDLRGVGGTRWLNLQAGRFQIPVGENYLRFGREHAKQPLISNTVAGPWFWDEGLRVFGSNESGTLGYVASLTDGETDLNLESDADKQVTLKLFAQPFHWLYLSASALRSGELGSASTPAESAIWWGESWARAFGSGSPIPNYVDGAAVADGPNELKNVVMLGGDAILRYRDAGKLWLSYGTVDIDSEGADLYDRDLRYWIAELMLEGGSLSRDLEPLYLVLRANGLGTYKNDEGYLLDLRYTWSLGYNMRSLEAYSVGLGWRLASGLNLRLEYTMQDVDLVRGVPQSMIDSVERDDYFGAAFGLTF